MGKKRKKSGRIVKPIIIITSIALLNFIGISYAYWNDSLQIITKITTGRLDVWLNRNNISANSNDITLIQGESGSLDYDIDSNMSVEFIGDSYSITKSNVFKDDEDKDLLSDENQAEELNSQWITDGITLSYSKGKLNIGVDENQKPGRYSYKGILRFRQKLR